MPVSRRMREPDTASLRTCTAARTRRLAEELKSLCGQFHGEVGRRFVERAAREDKGKLAAFLRDSVEKFVREFAPRAGEQAKRVARRFGLLAAAGELATRWELTGWPDGEAIRGCADCFGAWLENFGAGNHEERVIEERAQGFFQRHGASRFQDAAKPEAYVPNRAGYWR